MKGFEIEFNERIIQAGVDSGMILIIIHNDKGGMTISGSDDTSGKKLDWGRFELNIGDVISITACDVNDNSLNTHPKDQDRKGLLKRYNELKKYLTEQGLIP